VKRNLSKYIRWIEQALSLPTEPAIHARMGELKERHRYCSKYNCCWDTALTTVNKKIFAAKYKPAEDLQ